MIALSPISREKSYMCVRLKKGGGRKSSKSAFLLAAEGMFCFRLRKIGFYPGTSHSRCQSCRLDVYGGDHQTKAKKKEKRNRFRKMSDDKYKSHHNFSCRPLSVEDHHQPKKKAQTFRARERAIKRQKFFYPLNVSA